MQMASVNRRRFLQLAGGEHRSNDAVRQHRSRARDPGQPSDSLAQGHRAHRRADAGEPLVRPLLRRDARCPRVRRSAPGHAAERPVRLAPGRRVDRRAAVPPACGRQRSRAHVHRGSRPQLGWDASDVQQRQLGPVAAGQDHHVHGAHGAQGPAVPLRARRRVHGVRRIPLLDARPDRHQPLLHVDRLGWQRREERRPRDRQRRDRVRVADLPGAAGEGGDQLEDLPGRRRGPR